MKKVLSFLLILLLSFSLTGCALVEYFQNKQYEVYLGDGKNTVKWHLVSSDNAYRAVESAHFEFDEKTFKYYENGVLKKEGDYSATYFGLENSNTPLHLNLNFGKNENGFSIFDYIDCYTEDDKNALGQFTVVSEGYHIEPLRSGGVPVRDYHLSDMPYAFGTYVREGAEQYTYQNGKVNYLGSAKLDGCTNIITLFGSYKEYPMTKVHGDARVYGNARIFGNAEICGHAKVYDDARVYTNAFIAGSVNVFGRATVYDRIADNSDVYEFVRPHGYRICRNN
jgi:hypothetical protein